jgi:hypothetical protein
MSAVQEYVDAVTTLREVQQRVDESESRCGPRMHALRTLSPWCNSCVMP